MKFSQSNRHISYHGEDLQKVFFYDNDDEVQIIYLEIKDDRIVISSESDIEMVIEE